MVHASYRASPAAGLLLGSHHLSTLSCLVILLMYLSSYPLADLDNLGTGCVLYIGLTLVLALSNLRGLPMVNCGAKAKRDVGACCACAADH